MFEKKAQVACLRKGTIGTNEAQRSSSFCCLQGVFLNKNKYFFKKILAPG